MGQACLLKTRRGGCATTTSAPRPTAARKVVRPRSAHDYDGRRLVPEAPMFPSPRLTAVIVLTSACITAASRSGIARAAPPAPPPPIRITIQPDRVRQEF